MTGALDTEMRQAAQELIQEFGKPVTWTVGPTSADYDVSSGKASAPGTTHSAIVAIVSPEAGVMVSGGTLTTGEVEALLAAKDLAFTPKLGDSFALSSVQYQVTGVEAVYSGAQIAVWDLQCRK